MHDLPHPQAGGLTLYEPEAAAREWTRLQSVPPAVCHQQCRWPRKPHPSATPPHTLPITPAASQGRLARTPDSVRVTELSRDLRYMGSQLQAMSGVTTPYSSTWWADNFVQLYTEQHRPEGGKVGWSGQARLWHLNNRPSCCYFRPSTCAFVTSHARS
jgi:hypothetical protein